MPDKAQFLCAVRRNAQGINHARLCIYLFYTLVQVRTLGASLKVWENQRSSGQNLLTRHISVDVPEGPFGEPGNVLVRSVSTSQIQSEAGPRSPANKAKGKFKPHWAGAKNFGEDSPEYSWLGSPMRQTASPERLFNCDGFCRDRGRGDVVLGAHVVRQICICMEIAGMLNHVMTG